MPIIQTKFGDLKTVDVSVNLDYVHPELLKRVSWVMRDPRLSGKIAIALGSITYQLQAFLYNNAAPGSGIAVKNPDEKMPDGRSGSPFMVQKATWVHPGGYFPGEYSYSIEFDFISADQNWDLLREICEENKLKLTDDKTSWAPGHFVLDGKTDFLSELRNPPANPVLNRGSTGNSVEKLQSLLNQYGYANPALTVDGIFGPLTETAVRLFQVKNNLTSDGVVSSLTWKALATPEKNDTPTIPGSGGIDLPDINRVLSYRPSSLMIGPDVARLQESLAKLGYSIEVDGAFGPATDSIVRDFQSRSNITANGEVDLVFWDAIIKFKGTITFNNPAPTSTTRVQGIDVSNWQSRVNWPAMRSAGIEFAFVKATEILPGSNRRFYDVQFQNNVAGARASGIKVGAYHFSHAGIYSVKEEVDHFLSALTGKENLPPVLDLEDTASLSLLGPRGATQWTLEWLDAVEKSTGVRPIIYTGFYIARDYLYPDPRLAEYHLWLPWYQRQTDPPAPAPWKRWTAWQYSSTGSKGGTSPLDLNVMLKEDLDNITLRNV